MSRFSLPYFIRVCVVLLCAGVPFAPSVLYAQQQQQPQPRSLKEIELSKPTKLFFTLDYSRHKGAELLSFGLFHARWKETPDEAFRPGFYASFTTNLDTERPIFYDFLTVDSFPQHPIEKRYSRTTMVNFGLTFATSRSLILYGGLGFGIEAGRVELNDASGALNNSGERNYSVPDEATSRSAVNLNLGAIVRVKRVGINVGINTFTAAPYIGAAWGF